MRKQSVLALALIVGLSGGFALPVRAAGKSNLYDQLPAGCEKTVKMFHLSGFDQCLLSTVCADSITLQLNGKEITIPLCNSEGQYGQPDCTTTEHNCVLTKDSSDCGLKKNTENEKIRYIIFSFNNFRNNIINSRT